MLLLSRVLFTNPFCVHNYLNFDTKGMIKEITSIDMVMISCVNPFAVGINR